ncbi:cell wall-binding repeat-containing protein [Clostridium botulinum]|uniref:Putative cell surface protein n=1 Tax=Clostridium botulinum (strain Langeland / NCTC 10281 / Type F) TaxID=441772 RepID=A7GAD6_CLOBL|nr:cell wall-binding repeat-containing protein [Clostridium botulinum]ABS42325.1 putative cell surface protein [Clostridium botulinum F str. Langeland]ADF98212.1 putative cell surface protein [Clostridium botulinum F str. 230613]KKM41431.1 S-layer protein [Clostridium botulinum]MBY6794469.1 cell wall-binding repeat-containing protein [Clostridium botulinum]MBY6938257.1 cell wall-binding repeat-containing protein [Clostridium botulinum]
MNKKGTRALASATVVGLVLATVATGNVKAAPGDVNKVQGNDRYETAANVAKANWKDGAKDVIIASGNGYADSLSASVLAKKLNAPIILTTAGELNSNAKSALQTLKPENVYVIGGNASVSEAVRSGLKKDYKVTELGGKTRFETNLAVANHLVDKLGVKADNVMVVNGQDGFSDALSAAPVAAAKEQVLLIVGRDASTADAAANFVKKHNSKVTVIGTEGVVPKAVYDKLGASERVNGGKDRFDTNLKIMEHFKLNADNIYVANATDGQNGYADALVASALAGRSGAPLVLVDTKDAQGTKNAIKYIADNKTDKTEVSTVGGKGVMPDEIVNEIETAVNPELSAAEKAVKAYEDAKIGTSDEIAAAKALKADAVKAVDNVKDATKKSAFEARIAAKDKAISDAEAKLGVRVESVEAINLNQIKVAFTQKVKEDSAINVENYKLAGDKLTDADAKAKLLDDDKTVIITLKDAKNQNTTKKFEVKDNVIQEKDSGKTVSAFEQDITFKDLTAPTVEKITMDGAKTLKITFSEGVQTANAIASENYKIDGQSISSFGAKITAMNEVNNVGTSITNEVKIEFDSPIASGKHTLTIGASTSKEILDLQNFTLQKVDMPFTVNDVKSEPKIESATGKVNGEVTLEFNVKMDEGSIDSKNFLYNGISASRAELDSDDQDDKTVKVYFDNTSFDEGANVLKILQGKLKDVYGNKVAPDDDKRISFTVSKDNTAPVLKDAYAVSETKIRLVFSESIESKYFSDMKSNGSIKLKNSDGDTEYGNKTNPWGNIELVKNHSNEIELTMPEGSNYARLGKANYDIVVKDICDKAGNDMVESKKTITTIDNTDPKLREGSNLLINEDKQTAKVLFNEPMDKDSIGQLSNYLYDTGDGFKKLPSGSSITVANDGKAATINFPKDTVKAGWIDKATVRVMNVKDAAGNIIDGNVATTETAKDATTSKVDAPDFIDNLTVYGNDNEVWAEVDVNDNIDALAKEDFKLDTTKDADGNILIHPVVGNDSDTLFTPKSVTRNGKKLTITWDNEKAIKAFKAAGKKIRIPSNFEAKTTANEEGIKLLATDNYDAEDKIAPELMDKVGTDKNTYPVIVNKPSAEEDANITIRFNEIIKNTASLYEDDFSISIKGKSVDSDDIAANVVGNTIKLSVKNTDDYETAYTANDITIKFKSNVDIKDESDNSFVPSTDEKTGRIDITETDEAKAEGEKVAAAKSDATVKKADTAEVGYVIDNSANTIVGVPAGTVADLKADIVVNNAKATLKVTDASDVEITDGTTALANGQKVVVKAEDGTTRTYVITLAVAKSNDATVKKADTAEVGYVIDSSANTIVGVPAGTVADLKADIVVNNAKATLKVTDASDVEITDDTTALVNGQKVVVKAEDGTTKTYVITLA